MNIRISRSVSFLFKIHAFHEYFFFFYILIIINEGKGEISPSKYDTRRYVRGYSHDGREIQRERERIELIADQGVELFDQFVSLRYFNQPNWLPSIKFRGRS